MRTRTVVACVCALALQLSVYAQDAFINVKVSDLGNRDQEEVEKRLLSELLRELNEAKSDALQLYTDYTGQAGKDMKAFMKNITSYAQDALKAVETGFEQPICRNGFEIRMQKIKKDAYKAAAFSGENHHMFLLGHMVVFRMHLNKTEEYIRKCEKALYGCNAVFCENMPKVKRWKRQALNEIHRVKDDLQHTRRSYKDLVTHAKRRLNHIRKQIYMSTSDAVEDFHKCLDGTSVYDKL